MQTTKCFKKGLGAASAGVSQVLAPCCPPLRTTVTPETQSHVLFQRVREAVGRKQLWDITQRGRAAPWPQPPHPGTQAPPPPRAGAPLPREAERLNPAGTGTSSPSAPAGGGEGQPAPRPPRATLSRQSLGRTRGAGRRPAVTASTRPFLEPSLLAPRCTAGERHRQYYCSDAHLPLTCAGGLALTPSAVRTGASRRPSLGISHGAGSLRQPRYPLLTRGRGSRRLARHGFLCMGPLPRAPEQPRRCASSGAFGLVLLGFFPKFMVVYIQFKTQKRSVSCLSLTALRRFSFANGTLAVERRLQPVSSTCLWLL